MERQFKIGDLVQIYDGNIIAFVTQVYPAESMGGTRPMPPRIHLQHIGGSKFNPADHHGSIHFEPYNYISRTSQEKRHV